MVDKEDFIKYINELISSDKTKIRTLSKKYLLFSIIMMILGVSVMLNEILFLINTHFYLFTRRFLIGIICFVSGLIVLIIRRKNKKYFRCNYREKIINYLLNDYSHWFKEEGCSMSLDFEDSQFVKSYDICSTSDCLIINIPNDDGSESQVDFKICDLYAYNIHRDEEGNVSHSKVYRGMFATVEFPRKFECLLSIDVNYKRKGFKLEKVELEDIDFNKKFKVISDNQIEARYILTPQMMENLLCLEEKFKNLKVVFVDKYLYIGAPNINLFELDNFKKNDYFSVFENLYDEVNVCLKIVEEIKDNNKVFKTERNKRANKNKIDK